MKEGLGLGTRKMKEDEDKQEGKNIGQLAVALPKLGAECPPSAQGTPDSPPPTHKEAAKWKMGRCFSAKRARFPS